MLYGVAKGREKAAIPPAAHMCNACKLRDISAFVVAEKQKKKAHNSEAKAENWGQ